MTNSPRQFFTPELLARQMAGRMESPRGPLVIAACRSGATLGRAIAGHYQRLLEASGSTEAVTYLENIDWQFSDTETGVRINRHVSGSDVFIIQSLYNPVARRSVDENYLALWLSARGFREHGVENITAVVPYLAYGRQDKPTKFQREPVAAKLVADCTAQAGAQRVIAWHPHSDSIQGFFSAICTNFLSPIAVIAEAWQRFADRTDTIVVAPDAGAAKDVTAIGRALHLPCAVATKERPAREVANVVEIMGDFHGKIIALVTDDIISGGHTFYELVKKLAADKGIEKVYGFVSHNLGTAQAMERLRELHDRFHLEELMVTNTIPPTPDFLNLPFVRCHDLSEMFARVVNRVHYNRSVSEIIL